MLEATSQFYQGGATSSQIRAASFAEEAAKAQVNAVYLQVLDQIRNSREQIENKTKTDASLNESTSDYGENQGIVSRTI